MDEFRVGDLAVGKEAQFYFERNGMQCEIIGPLEFRTYDCPRGTFTQPCYLVRWSDGRVTCARPHQLMRIPPPKREDVGEWELCPWRPAVRHPTVESPT